MPTPCENGRGRRGREVDLDTGLTRTFVGSRERVPRRVAGHGARRRTAEVPRVRHGRTGRSEGSTPQIEDLTADLGDSGPGNVRIEWYPECVARSGTQCDRARIGTGFGAVETREIVECVLAVFCRIPFDTNGVGLPGGQSRQHRPIRHRLSLEVQRVVLAQISLLPFGRMRRITGRVEIRALFDLDRWFRRPRCITGHENETDENRREQHDCGDQFRIRQFQNRSTPAAHRPSIRFGESGNVTITRPRLISRMSRARFDAPSSTSVPSPPQ